MKQILKWVAGIIFLFSAIGSIGMAAYASIVFLLIGAAFCIPPTHQFIVSRISLSLQSWQKYLIVFTCFVLGSMLIPNNYAQKASNSNSNNESQQNAIKLDNNDQENSGLQLTDRLKKELASFDKPFETASFRGTQEAVNTELVVFSVWGKLIEQADSSSNEEVRKLSQTLRQKVVNLQIAEFPKMRKEVADLLDKKLWENDIEVRCIGNKNTTIDFIGGYFAANKNIKQTQISLHDIFHNFRFKRTQYRWIPSADEYTYYPVDSPDDSELVKIQ
jgi:hypothetical protein